MKRTEENTDIPSLIGDPTSRRFASDDVLFFAKSEKMLVSPLKLTSSLKIKPVGFHLECFGPIFRGKLAVVFFLEFPGSNMSQHQGGLGRR